MDRQTAKILVSNYWTNGSSDSRLSKALATLGISRAVLEQCSREARKVERGLGPLLLSPIGCGKRSR